MDNFKKFLKSPWAPGILILVVLLIINFGFGSTGLVQQGVSNFSDIETSGGVTVGGNLAVTGTSSFNGTTSFTGAISPGVISQTVGTENLGGLTSVVATSIDIDNDSSPVTCASIGAGEIWFVHAVYANVLDNFVATGDDAALTVGDGGDADGLLVLADAELQAADTEGTGAVAGWQGFFSTDTVGAYLAQGLGFVYNPAAAETIDCAFSGTDLASTTADDSDDITIYVVYSRIQ